LSTCGAEVQKGNAPEERKIARLFRNPEVTTLIKRCNDFGAGGVSVAIGELADGLIIDLDSVPTKYDGLDGTEIAISESQERMAIVVTKENADKIIQEADKENLSATLVAVVTEEPRLTMHWKGNTIVDLSREFLNSNGAVKHTNIHVTQPELTAISQHNNSKESWLSHVSDLNICSQKGLTERFDSTIGGGTVLAPLGGKKQLTPIQAMVAKLPVLNADTSTCSLMSWGYNPFLSEQSPFHGAMSAVIESIAKIIATGGTRSQCWLSFQEFFEDPKNDPIRWGKPFSALLGAFKAQLELGCGAIGGKDSMSGSFEDIDVPPTLISFAVSASDSVNIISPEFKDAGDKVILLSPDYDENGVPVFESVRNVFDTVEKLIKDGIAKSAWAVGYGGIAEAIAKMCFGNGLGFDFKCSLTDKDLFEGTYGSFVIAVDKDADIDGKIIGNVSENAAIKFDEFSINIKELQSAWENKLEPIFPTKIDKTTSAANAINFSNSKQISPSIKVAKPRVVIPIVTGTNSEYDLSREFENAGANVEVFVMRDRNVAEMQESINGLESIIRSSQIMVLPSGFAGGEKSEGSGMFLASLLSNAKIKDAVLDLLNNRDGLILGINSGFNALLKLGLLPYGEYREVGQSGATLTSNVISRYQSKLVNTRIASNKSPWLYSANVGDIHTLPISHDEGRFIASDELIGELAKNGQIAAQYVDFNGDPTMDIRFNPSTSACAIEAISSPDGRILGKMAHNERIGSDNIYKNITGNFDHNIFKDGVNYFL
ncbi:MAG: phosphoribosylformylglycinamidine synthase, partial [Clostridiales bacterium]|nr:phosphoribosylformylglycinamidine synthase [Clostridiales bacterium]